MEFKSLAPHLHPTAEAVVGYVRGKFGWSNFKTETEISPDIQLRPTLQTTSHEFETICIEVSESPYSGTLDEAVIACKNDGLPVKLFCAIPKINSEGKDFQEKLRRAKKNGVGIIEVDENGAGMILADALSLALSGVRKIEPKDFPPKLREVMGNAESSFYANPAKGCAVVYDELEHWFRQVADKTQKLGLWTPSQNYNFKVDPWAKITKDMLKTFPVSGVSNPVAELKSPLIAQVLGVTGHRNEVGHKPKSRADLIRRNRELRTRFESAVDLLRDLVAATKRLRL